MAEISLSWASCILKQKNKSVPLVSPRALSFKLGGILFGWLPSEVLYVLRGCLDSLQWEHFPACVCVYPASVTHTVTLKRTASCCQVTHRAPLASSSVTPSEHKREKNISIAASDL